ncbi:hypothetical protein N8T08_007718 [Aspergillus melleus]|uniref:Uncharacterized protein n=1 Tax=Aspergillus melleus TaxID=138277 RepID=A0ACC3BF45_9EURO|nr:hypothetical protein N8T08_007718 [Aspergillus melleus]
MAHARDSSQRPVPSKSQLHLAVCFVISALQAILPFAKRTIKSPDTGEEVTMNDLENDADLLVTGLDMSSACRDLLKGSYFSIDGNILDVAVDATFVKVDFVSE